MNSCWLRGSEAELGVDEQSGAVDARFAGSPFDDASFWQLAPLLAKLAAEGRSLSCLDTVDRNTHQDKRPDNKLVVTWQTRAPRPLVSFAQFSCACCCCLRRSGSLLQRKKTLALGTTTRTVLPLWSELMSSAEHSALLSSSSFSSVQSALVPANS